MSRRYSAFCKIGGLLLATTLKISVNHENVSGEGTAFGPSVGVGDDSSCNLDVYQGKTIQDLVPLNLGFQVFGAQALAGFIRIAMINKADDSTVADIHMYVGGIMACVGLSGNLKLWNGGINM